MGYARIFAIIYAYIAVHEAAHALAFAAFGFPVSEYVIGWGPTISWMFGDTRIAFGPIPLGGHCTQPADVPWSADVLSTLAGPMIGILVACAWFGSPLWTLHKWSIIGSNPIRIKVGIFAHLMRMFLLSPNVWATQRIWFEVSVWNLLPIPPLDGSKVLFSFFPDTDFVKRVYGALSVGFIVTFTIIVTLVILQKGWSLVKHAHTP